MGLDEAIVYPIDHRWKRNTKKLCDLKRRIELFVVTFLVIFAPKKPTEHALWESN